MTGLYALFGLCMALATATMVGGSIALGYGWASGAGVAVVFFAIAGALGWAIDTALDASVRRSYATGGVVVPHQHRPDRVQALLSPGYALIGGEWRAQGDDAAIDALNAGEGVALTRTCTCRFSTRVDSSVAVRHSDGCEMHGP